MSKLKIKVCGMRNAENIQEISNLQTDLLGFIFYDKSPRYVGNYTLPKQKNKVGVFVNETIENILRLDALHQFKYIQLHGDESAGFCKALKAEGKNLIKAFGVDQSCEFNKLKEYQNTVDFFLFDTKSKNYGGTGNQFDWSVLDNYHLKTPFLLSGGIDLGSTEEIVRLKQSKNTFYGIDLNSRFEKEPGLKDKNKLELFIKKLKKHGIA